MILSFFFFNDTATTEIYTLSLHDALPICCDASRNELVDPGEIGMRQDNVDRTDIVFQIRPPLRAWNGHDVFALSEHPGERQLRGRAALFFGYLLHPLRQGEVTLEVLTLKPRHVPPVVVC